MDRMKNTYTDELFVSRHCHFSWGENGLEIENYPVACIKAVLAYMEKRPKRRAFDVGCSVGRSSFELARVFDEVIGVDSSAHLIREALRLKESGILHYRMPDEGVLESGCEIRLNKFGLEHASKKVNFWQADACNLKTLFSGFDLVFAGNLIDRLYDPRKFLETMATRIYRNGLFILTSAYDWREEYTPKEKWIGGYMRRGEAIDTLQGLTTILGDAFRLLDSFDIPMVWQENARKYHYAVTQMSVWEKR